MINSKITKTSNQQTSEDRLFKVLESIDWKLWEMYNILKDNNQEKSRPAVKRTLKKSDE